MAIKRLSTDEDTYDEDHLTNLVRSLVYKDGVLFGFNVVEKAVNDEIYAIISPGAFIKSGIVYILEEEIDGSNLDPGDTHDLDITPHANDLNYTYGLDRLYSGRETIYIVETNTDPNNVTMEPVFKIKTSPGDDDLIISIRKVDWIFRLDPDPLSGDMTFLPEDGGDRNIIFAPNLPSLRVYEKFDPFGCMYLIAHEYDTNAHEVEGEENLLLGGEVLIPTSADPINPNVLASTTLLPHSPLNILDGNFGTAWQSEGMGSMEYLWIDFETDKQIVALDIWPVTGGIQDVALDVYIGSIPDPKDDSMWLEVDIKTYADQEAGFERKSFGNINKARYYRIRFLNDPGNGRKMVRDMKFYEPYILTA